jgi:hypothetical protein
MPDLDYHPANHRTRHVEEELFDRDYNVEESDPALEVEADAVPHVVDGEDDAVSSDDQKVIAKSDLRQLLAQFRGIADDRCQGGNPHIPQRFPKTFAEAIEHAPIATAMAITQTVANAKVAVKTNSGAMGSKDKTPQRDDQAERRHADDRTSREDKNPSRRPNDGDDGNDGDDDRSRDGERHKKDKKDDRDRKPRRGYPGGGGGDDGNDGNGGQPSDDDGLPIARRGEPGESDSSRPTKTRN